MTSLPCGSLLCGKSYVYKIEKVLGQGTFGITYLATTRIKLSGALGEIETELKVAVKEFFMKDINGRSDSMVTCSSSGDLYVDYRRKFAREATNLSKLKHPHIVKVLELFETNNTCYYSMEYCEGGSLDTLIEKQQALDEQKALTYFRQISDAVSFMHENHMLHLDLKPLNIMLRRNGEAVLIDFGLSKQYTASGEPESSTRVGSGTPGYAPLEQANYREGKDFPVTMDVYALGATLFKMLSGICPPEASEILNEGFPAYELQQKGVSDELISCISKAMSPMRKSRYQSVHAFQQSLPAFSSSQKHYAEETEYQLRSLRQQDVLQPVHHLANVSKEKNRIQSINGHEYVDLSLPSGLKWATCNIGASRPEDYGDYYAWGEIQTKSEYTEENSLTSGKDIGNISGNSRYDAARMQWGSSWRLPTQTEFQELIDQCTWEWTTEGGHNGMRVTGPNGHSIFLPAAGTRIDAGFHGHGSAVYYWSGINAQCDHAVCLYSQFMGTNSRFIGHPVRPVSE